MRDSSGTSSWTNLSIDNTKWHHFCITGDGTNATLYVNGESKGSQPDRSPTVDTIGSYSGGSDGFFNGNVSNLAIYNVILTASQVSTLFNFGTPETNISFDPVAWWKLDDQTAITDSSGNGNTGTNNGATNAPGGVAYVPSWKITSALPIPTVNYTSALDFDGGNQYVTIGNPTSVQFTNDFTITGWFKTTSTALQRIISKDNATSGGRSYFVRVDSVLTGGIFVNNSGKNNNSSFTVNDGNWHFFSFVYEQGTGTTLYVDNNTPSFLSETNNVDNGSADLEIGRRQDNQRLFDGSISNVAIYNSALTSSQISTLFNSGQPEAAISFSPVSWWKLDTGGSTITDYGSGGNNGTNNGATQVTSDVLISGFNIPVNGVSTTLPSTALQQSDLQFDSPYSNYSLSFDGIGDYIQTGGFTIGNNYSFSCWLKSNTTTPSSMCFLSSPNYYSVGYDGNFVIRFTNATQIQMYSYNERSDSESSTVTIPSIDTNWHHFSLTSNGTTTNIYWDGSPLTVTGNQTKSLDNISQGLIIGDNITGNNNAFNGKIDETAVWNTALTEAQVLEIYNNGKPGDLDNFSGTAPISWWRLGENAYFDNNSFVVPNSIAGAPNGIGSGTVTTMLSADAPGTYANGIGDGLAITDRVGDAPLSVANSQSYNMIPDDKVPYVPGYVGAQIANTYSMTFDGTNYFNAGNDTSLNWGTANGTVSCWFKTSYNASGVQDLVINGSYASGGKGYILYLDSSERVGFYLDDNSSPSGVLSTSSVNDGDWHHVVGVRNSGTMKLYLDGSEIATGTDNTGNIDISDPLIIGAGQAFGGSVGNFFNGQIDEVAIFDKALTADQIKFDLYEPTVLVGGVEKTADIENNTNLPTPVAWYRMGD